MRNILPLFLLLPGCAMEPDWPAPSLTEGVWSGLLIEPGAAVTQELQLRQMGEPPQAYTSARIDDAVGVAIDFETCVGCGEAGADEAWFHVYIPFDGGAPYTCERHATELSFPCGPIYELHGTWRDGALVGSYGYPDAEAADGIDVRGSFVLFESEEVPRLWSDASTGDL